MDLRGASAESLSAVSGSLRDAVAGGADAAAIADELFAVASAVRAEGTLRRVLTDVSIPGEAKQGLARDILAGKAGEATTSLVEQAVASRWTSGRDLPDALERLSQVAVARSAAGGAVDEGERLSDELFAVQRLVDDNADLRDALSDPARTRADKEKLIESLLAGKALPATVTLAKQALAGSYRTVSAALKEYQAVAAAVRNESVATVRVARALSDADLNRLGQALSAQYGRTVHLNVIVDPAVLGGIKVELGDDVIDGTVASRLDDARRRLAS
ncbi:MAG: F0F1 ATP synthase subunit delta [Nocardioidaceae bacterium]